MKIGYTLKLCAPRPSKTATATDIPRFDVHKLSHNLMLFTIVLYQAYLASQFDDVALPTKVQLQLQQQQQSHHLLRSDLSSS